MMEKGIASAKTVFSQVGFGKSRDALKSRITRLESGDDKGEKAKDEKRKKIFQKSVDILRK